MKKLILIASILVLVGCNSYEHLPDGNAKLWSPISNFICSVSTFDGATCVVCPGIGVDCDWDYDEAYKKGRDESLEGARKFYQSHINPLLMNPNCNYTEPIKYN